MDLEAIFSHFYENDTYALKVLKIHSRMVAKKAVEIAENIPELNPDIKLIKEAANLHDIGIIKTHAPGIGCHGNEPYITHGVLGRKMLESLNSKYNLERHALICERHTGAGLTEKEIKKAELPLPVRDMLPLSLEEKIICFADKFFSKNPDTLETEIEFPQILKRLENFGIQQKKRFLKWAKLFRYE